MATSSSEVAPIQQFVAHFLTHAPSYMLRQLDAKFSITSSVGIPAWLRPPNIESSLRAMLKMAVGASAHALGYYSASHPYTFPSSMNSIGTSEHSGNPIDILSLNPQPKSVASFEILQDLSDPVNLRGGQPSHVIKESTSRANQGSTGSRAEGNAKSRRTSVSNGSGTMGFRYFNQEYHELQLSDKEN